MLGVVLGVYSLFIILIWGLFILVRIHALKFNNFQSKLAKYLKILCAILGLLTIIGYILIFIVVSNDSFDKIGIGSDNSSLPRDNSSAIYY